MSRRASVACLTGAGTAPELMAEAVLALDAVARLHGLSLHEVPATLRRCAAASRGLAVVGDAAGTELADGVALGHDHVEVEHLAPRVALPLAAFNASRFDVVAVVPASAAPMVEIAAAPATARVAAHPLLAEHGPR